MTSSSTKPANVISTIRQLAQTAEKITDWADYHVSTDEVRLWLNRFADGVDYVQRTYDSSIGGFGVFTSINNSDKKQETTCCILYDATADFVAVTKGFIARDIINTRGLKAIFGNHNTSPRSDFTGPEMFFLLGVEEAYHAHQYKTMRDQFPAEDWATGTDQDNIGSSAHYQNNAVEQDARLAVLKAADDLGLGTEHKTQSTQTSQPPAPHPTPAP